MESGQVPEKGLGEYREMVEFGRVPEKCPGEYREMVESKRVPEKDGIQASTREW